MRSLSVVLAGGGSAGHISPALAVAEALLAEDPAVRITALGTDRGLETRLVPAAGHSLELIPSVPLPRGPDRALLAVPGRVGSAVAAADRIIRDVAADVVVGFGSYVALPAYLAARRRRIPFIVHEQNMRPGIGNRIGARLTRHVGVVAGEVPLPHKRVVGMPLRRSIGNLDRHANRLAARARFGLDPDRPTLLVTGGSQGARSINQASVAAAPRYAEAGVQVLHIVGPKHTVAVQQRTGWPPYAVVSYVDEMALAYSAADLVLCRAGMNTVCELTTVGLPGVYVPLPVGNGEQRLNAEPVVAAGGGLLVSDVDLSAAWIGATVLPVLTDAARLGAMASAAASRGHRESAGMIAAWAREVARR